MRRWLAALAVLQVLDITLTELALRAGAHEANPLLAPVVHTPIPFISKVSIMALIWFLAVYTKAQGRVLRWIKAAVAVYALVALNNLTVLALKGV